MIDRSGVWGDPPPLVGRRLGGHPVDEGGNVRPVLLQVRLFLLQLLQQPVANKYNSNFDSLLDRRRPSLYLRIR